MSDSIPAPLTSGRHVPPLAEVAHNNQAVQISPPTPAALLLTARAAAALCGVSLRTWWRWDASGAVPAPVIVGRNSKRWRRGELEAWAAVGCPLREQWLLIQHNDARHRTGLSAKRARR